MKRLRHAFLALALLILPTALRGTVLEAGPQIPKPIPDLTVPASRLSPGCTLAPQSHFEPVIVWQSGGVTAKRIDPNITANVPPNHPVNPWVGSDVQSVGWVRSHMSFDGRTPAFGFTPVIAAHDPDVITDPRQVKNLQQAPDVVASPTTATARPMPRPDWTGQAVGLAEGYSAVYLESGASELTVRAVRINPNANPQPRFPTAPNAVKIGSDVVAVIEPDAGPCARAIQTYLKHLDR